MKLKVQMIGVDLDGTLLTTDKKLLPYTASVLKAAAGQGRLFCLLPAVRCAVYRRNCWRSPGYGM